MDNDEYMGPVVLDPVVERAAALIAVAEAIDRVKDPSAKKILRGYASKIYDSIKLPSGGEVVELKAIEGGKE